MRQRRVRSARQREAPEDQLNLLADEGWWRCQGIFSPTYLRNHVINTRNFPSAEESANTWVLKPDTGNPG